MPKKMKAGQKTLSIDWVALITAILQILSTLFSKKQAAEFQQMLTDTATEYGGLPDVDKAVAAKTLLQAAFDNTKRVRVGRRALLRWALADVPPVMNDPKPKLPKAVLDEGKKLAGRDD